MSERSNGVPTAALQPPFAPRTSSPAPALPPAGMPRPTEQHNNNHNNNYATGVTLVATRRSVSTHSNSNSNSNYHANFVASSSSSAASALPLPNPEPSAIALRTPPRSSLPLQSTPLAAAASTAATSGSDSVHYGTGSWVAAELNLKADFVASDSPFQHSSPLPSIINGALSLPLAAFSSTPLDPLQVSFSSTTSSSFSGRAPDVSFAVGSSTSSGRSDHLFPCMSDE